MITPIDTKEIGTITWFDIKKRKPIDKGGLWVLCFYDSNVAPEVLYYWACTESFSMNKKPKYWAYINYPE